MTWSLHTETHYAPIHGFTIYGLLPLSMHIIVDPQSRLSIGKPPLR